MLTESLTLAKELDDKGCMADALVVMAYITFFRSDHDAMQRLLDEAFALYRAVGDRRGRALCLYGQGWLALSRGNYAAAHACYEEGLSILVELGHQWFSALCIEGLAYAESLQAQWIRAARLWGMAHALRERIGVAVPSILTAMYGRVIAQVRTQLGESDFTIAWAEGRMSSISLQETGHLTLQEGV
ncbi:MAG TPA: tetratricopeptide repeat protein [Ktedonobacteraceae bacterium]|nr:tetratricopeptide repeat protein [Ktedonobacteraceae bacterium]